MFFIKLATTGYMENKVLVYGVSFPDKRNFCSRLAFLLKDNKMYVQIMTNNGYKIKILKGNII